MVESSSAMAKAAAVKRSSPRANAAAAARAPQVNAAVDLAPVEPTLTPPTAAIGAPQVTAPPPQAPASTTSAEAATVATPAPAAPPTPSPTVLSTSVASSAPSTDPTSLQRVDEAQVQAVFGAHAHHNSMSISVTPANSSAPTSITSSGVTTTVAAATTASVTAPSDAATLQALARQQDEYRRKLEQLQLQQQQQLQWHARQQAQQQLKLQEQAERQDRMQHIQQKLHERIQLKQQQQQQLGSPVASVAAAAAVGASAQAPTPTPTPTPTAATATAPLPRPAAAVRPDERAMHQSIAEHQQQIFAAMVRDLERQSGVPLTPLPSPAIGASAATQQLQPPVVPAAAKPPTAALPELVPVPLAPAATLAASTAKAYEDFQRARQEQLLRLQQFQLEQQRKLQHVAATVSVASSSSSSSSPAAAAAVAVPTPQTDAMRKQLLAEQERLRAVQSEQQQQTQQSTAAAVLSPEQQLQQQHDILRQQQARQTLQHQKQLSARAQQQQQSMPVRASGAAKTPAPVSTPIPGSAPSDDTPQPPAAKKRKKAAAKPAASETLMEALVRELIRLNAAGTSSELRTSLDRVTAWVHRCIDPHLLRLAQRDFREIVAAKRPALVHHAQWTPDVQTKCEYIGTTIAQVIVALQQQQQAPSAGASVPAGTAPATTSSETDAIHQRAKEHAYVTLKAQMLQQHQHKLAAKASAAAATAGVKKTKKKAAAATAGLHVDLALVGGSASQRDGTKASDATSGTPATASVSANASTPVPKAAAALAPPPKPMSPSVVQQFYDVDLSSRSCVVPSEDSEEKLYIPMKSIAKVMRRALPGATTSASSASTASVVSADGPKSVTAVNDSGTAELLKSESGAAEATPLDASLQGDEPSTVTRAAAAAAAAASTSTNTSNEQVCDGDGDGDGDGGDSSAKPARSASAIALALQRRKDAVRSGIKIDDAAVAFMQECVTEFILFLTSEAKDQCAFDKKKPTASLLGSHVVAGCENLGLSAYARVLEGYNVKVKRMQDAVVQKRVKKLQDRKLQQEQQRQIDLAAAQTDVPDATAAAAAAGAAGTDKDPVKQEMVNAGDGAGVDAGASAGAGAVPSSSSKVNLTQPSNEAVSEPATPLAISTSSSSPTVASAGELVLMKSEDRDASRQ